MFPDGRFHVIPVDVGEGEDDVRAQARVDVLRPERPQRLRPVVSVAAVVAES